MMKKLLALFLTVILVVSVVACSKDDVPEETPKPDLVPSITQEELKEQVDFENADPATAEDGEVVVPSGRAATETDASSATIETDEVPKAVLRSELPPDEVWESESGAAYSYYGNFTLPDSVLMDDGSLGTLAIPKLDLMVQVFETVDNELASMVHGVAHFKETSCWDGNVGIAGHNQGVNTYFAELYTLVEGDKITLTTALGERTYAVSKSVEIDETDWSYLERTDNNVLTLITCVNHDLTNRLCVQAVEVEA